MATKGKLRREIIHAEGAPGHGPGLIQGVIAGGFIFLSALRGVDPALGGDVSEDPKKQAEQIFVNMKLLLAGAGATLDDVAKITVYMRNLQTDRPAFNEVWIENFPTDPPARHAVEVVDIGRPGGKTLYQLDVTAVAP